MKCQEGKYEKEAHERKQDEIKGKLNERNERIKRSKEVEREKEIDV